MADRTLFNDIADQYCRKDLSRASRVARRQRLRQTLRPLRLGPNVSILEVGCGAGFSARYLAGCYSRFVGIDYADNLIAYARTHNAGPGVSFEAVNVKDYVPREKFDVVLMIGVLHHFDAPAASLMHIAGMLKPEGWLVANEPQSANVLVQGLRRLRSALDRSYSPDQRQFSAKQLRALYAESGLKNILVVPQGVLSTPFAEVALKPDVLFRLPALLAVATDRLLEAGLGRLLTPVSWNLIAVGRSRAAPMPDP